MMGRATLKHLKASTLLTLIDVLHSWGLTSEKNYWINWTDSTITFFNGSTIFMRELSVDPSDPEFDKLGSTEFTGVFLDECSQISTKAKNIVMSRIRYKLEEYEVIPKMLMCSNPTKNFLYYDFYKPWKAGELAPYRAFIPALVVDNPYISQHYIDNLKKMDKVSKERLLYGNFEYDDDPSRLFDYDHILNMFTNEFVKKEGMRKYVSVDVARFGNDKTVIFVWEGFYIIAIRIFSKQSTKETEETINKIAIEFGIPRSQIVIDDDGIGGGVVDHLPGVKGFVNGSKPYERKTIKEQESKNTRIHNYGNLKAQCYWALADAINTDQIGITKDIPVEVKERLIEDLEQIKQKDPDKDGKLYVTPKEEIKENLGRSTDFGDALMMRMYFEVAISSKLVFGNIKF